MALLDGGVAGSLAGRLQSIWDSTLPRGERRYLCQQVVVAGSIVGSASAKSSTSDAVAAVGGSVLALFEVLMCEAKGAAGLLPGDPLGLGRLRRILVQADRLDLARRVQELSRARRAVAHPDVMLPHEVAMVVACHAGRVDVSFDDGSDGDDGCSSRSMQGDSSGCPVRSQDYSAGPLLRAGGLDGASVFFIGSEVDTVEGHTVLHDDAAEYEYDCLLPNEVCLVGAPVSVKDISVEASTSGPATCGSSCCDFGSEVGSAEGFYASGDDVVEDESGFLLRNEVCFVEAPVSGKDWSLVSPSIASSIGGAEAVADASAYSAIQALIDLAESRGALAFADAGPVGNLKPTRMQGLPGAQAVRSYGSQTFAFPRPRRCRVNGRASQTELASPVQDSDVATPQCIAKVVAEDMVTPARLDIRVTSGGGSPGGQGFDPGVFLRTVVGYISDCSADFQFHTGTVCMLSSFDAQGDAWVSVVEGSEVLEVGVHRSGLFHAFVPMD